MSSFKKTIFIYLSILGLFCIPQTAAADGEPEGRKPLVAAVWKEVGSADGREVVIEPDLKKLEAHGVTLEQLSEAIDGRRFAADRWTFDIDGKDVDLSKVAKLTLRELEAPPFTVKLNNGREVLITPNPKRVAHYVVSGNFFEQNVRDALADYSGKDPGEYIVLGMIRVPGNVSGGHFTEQDTMVHYSLGEPLETFAKVEVKSAPADDSQWGVNDVLFWIGIATAVLGAVLYVLSRTLLFPRVQRLINDNPAKLQTMIDSGQAKEMGEGAEELLREAIEYQLEHQVGTVPLAFPAMVLFVVGSLVAVVCYFVG